MKRNIYLSILPLFALLFWTACSKDRDAELRGDWLFPLAKGAFSINSMSALQNLQYDVDIPAVALNVPEGIAVSSPGLRISHVGPFALQISDWLRRVDIDTLEFRGRLDNFFPIPIGAGTRVTMRNSRDTSASSVVGEMVIGQDVPPGANFGFEINVYNKTLIDSVYIYLDDFRSPPYSNVTFSTRPSHLRISLGVVSASYLDIYTGKRFTSSDTTEFSAGSDDNPNQSPINDTSVRGQVNVFCDNGLPVGIRGQIYFLDGSRTRVLDSMFASDLFIGPGQTNAAGATTVTNSTTQRVTVSDRKLEAIKAARFIVTRFIVSSEGISAPFVGANREAALRLQFTGDLNITVRF